MLDVGKLKAKKRGNTLHSEGKSNRRHVGLERVQRPLRKIQIIKNFVLKQPIPVSPKTVAQKTLLNHNTCKNYCLKLAGKGKIVRLYTGAYCSPKVACTHTLQLPPLRTQNVLITSVVPWCNFTDKITEICGSVKIAVTFGIFRHKVSCQISCKEGMDHNTANFALSRAFDIVKERSGHSLDEVTLKTYELNRDFHGVRLNGCKCYTRKGLFDIIEKIYQKDDSTVRVEHKISRDMKPDEFLSLLHGGMSQFEAVQGIYFIGRKIDGLIDAMKYWNSQLLTLNKRLSKLEGA